MNKIWIAVIVVFLTSVLLGGYFYISSNSQPTLLTVIGEGKVKTAPELAQFTITYVATGNSSNAALTAEATQRQKIISLLANSFGVTNADIKVSFPRVAAPVAAANNELIYQAVNTIDVNFRRLTSLDQAVSSLYREIGESITVGNIIFTTSNARDLEDEAISLAIIDAKQRAQKMASTSGKKLGRLVSITGQQTQAVGTVAREVTKNQQSFGTVTQPETLPGQIEIIRNVSLVYELN